MLSKFTIYINRKHLCDVCGKSFGKKAILTEHIRTHTKEKPFICPYEGCGKAFSEKGNMTIHYKRHFKKQQKLIHSRDSYQMSFNELIGNYNMFDNADNSYRNHCDELTRSLFVNIAKSMNTIDNNSNKNVDDFIFEDHNYVHLSQVK